MLGELFAPLMMVGFEQVFWIGMKVWEELR